MYVCVNLCGYPPNPYTLPMVNLLFRGLEEEYFPLQMPDG